MGMGRPPKQTANYFPHFVGESRTKMILEQTWGNDGYAFWFKLLELLCRSKGQYYDCSSEIDIQYLSSVANVDSKTAIDIIEKLIALGQIDKDLWEKRKIIWVQTLVDNLAFLYSKRNTALPQKPSCEITEHQEASKPEITKPADPEHIVAAAEEKPQQEEKAPPKKREKPPKPKEPPKKAYAEFVTMTEEEYNKLVAEHGAEKVAEMIRVLDNYKGSSGKTYKSDYRAILNWVIERVNEEFAKKRGVPNGAYSAGFSPQSGSSPAGGFSPSTGFKQN